MPPSPSALSDGEMLALARAGDPAGFVALFERYYAAVRSFAARDLLDVAAGEDVAQETFVRAARTLEKMDGNYAIKPWLFRVASNLCKDHLRACAARHRKHREFVEFRTPGDGPEDGASEKVQAALAALPDRQRAAVVLVFYEGLSHAAAAHICGCAESTISWRILLAKRKLKTLLRP